MNKSPSSHTQPSQCCVLSRNQRWHAYKRTTIAQRHYLRQYNAGVHVNVRTFAHGAPVIACHFNIPHCRAKRQATSSLNPRYTEPCHSTCTKLPAGSIKSKLLLSLCMMQCNHSSPGAVKKNRHALTKHAQACSHATPYPCLGMYAMASSQDKQKPTWPSMNWEIEMEESTLG